ncbi:uncharacterized protein BO96DRAFT_436570 [Aspergillus niger CBS 101883]|uniref:Uncharacterized protein n=2 Tax=Aspergillus niger TaxID=5061 RepID=A2R3V7_ASPNC|nr:uncharacterized protein BO96DRAFT_436570 [Aspergillus niger CBS 101883]XP_059602369.1 hypothetical protein An14g05640 [Aspergillus niger]PYH54084.1 hypothetical protein BO96DRAFT_436570 [Aspergillus niger CBS 101883]CAK42125.1 hypothetical protein An14g05640 [Aspergillus niger]
MAVAAVSGRREPPSAMKMTIQEVGMFEQINLVPVIPGASSVIPVMAIFTADRIADKRMVCDTQVRSIAVIADRIRADLEDSTSVRTISTVLRSLSGLVLPLSRPTKYESLVLGGAENEGGSEVAGSAVIGDKHGPRTQTATPRPQLPNAAWRVGGLPAGGGLSARLAAIGLSDPFPTTRNTKTRAPPARPVHANSSIFSGLQVWRSLNGLPHTMPAMCPALESVPLPAPGDVPCWPSRQNDKPYFSIGAGFIQLKL